MALDAVFLLQCLQFYVRYLDQSSHDDVKNLGRALCPTCHGAADNYILRDLMMLENQLPLFLMKMLLELQLGSKAKAEERLSILLKLVYQELSPFVFKVPENSYLHINERGHLLEDLYSAIASPLSNYRKPDAPYPADISTVTPIRTRSAVSDGVRHTFFISVRLSVQAQLRKNHPLKSYRPRVRNWLLHLWPNCTLPESHSLQLMAISPQYYLIRKLPFFISQS